ncbi:MAG: hypothetical protein EHM54_00310 [Nitrospiraceae bacterium]|nr:MAG: hypothetical protein EHM54_00310 [Nitrospiraceae bacterium]
MKTSLKPAIATAFFRLILLLGLTMVLLSVFLVSPPAESGDADWRLIRQSTYGDSTYYDAASVKHQGDQVVSVRAKFGIGEYLYEMRCGKKEARLIEEGKTGGPDAGWFPIVNGSDEELIYLEVCR